MTGAGKLSVNLFMNGLYIFPCVATCMNYDSVLPQGFRVEVQLIEKYLLILYKKMPKFFPNSSLSYQDKMELSSIMTSTLSITYEPLNAYFKKNWDDLKDDEDISWKVVRIPQDQIQPVMVPHRNEQVDEFFSPTLS